MAGKITVIGLGPGNISDMTGAAISALNEADVIIGYSYYVHLISELKATGEIIRPDTEILKSGMKDERARAQLSFEEASKGKKVALISSGDSGIYGMSPLIYEMQSHTDKAIEIEVIPGISAFQKAASLLGAPTGHDFCVISLSDLMTPWSVIEKRIKAAATADFVTAIYNPRSHGRYWQLNRLKEIFLEERSPNTPIGYVRQAGRKDESVCVTDLTSFDPEKTDMFTIVIIGNSQSYIHEGKMITPRGYYLNQTKDDNINIGQTIMTESFRTIEKELKNNDIPIGLKWPLLHAIHTTADFDMENILKIDTDAIEKMYDALISNKTNVIVTDVTMVAAGIRKGALERLGITVKCYLNDNDVIEEAKEKGITRTQAGIRKAVKEHPEAIYAFGNAPTALMELCDLVRVKKAIPSGIIAAPVGFVHVEESKHSVKALNNIPKVIVEGRKGGSNLAATLVNSILCWPDAKQIKPGRDV